MTPTMLTAASATIEPARLRKLVGDVWSIADELDADLSLACLDESGETTTHTGDDLSTLRAEAEIGRATHTLDDLDGAIKKMESRLAAMRGQLYDAGEEILR